jgi:hypothetical protein
MRVNVGTLVDEFRRHAGETAVVAHRGNRRTATTCGELAGIAAELLAPVPSQIFTRPLSRHCRYNLARCLALQRVLLVRRPG